MKIMLYCGSNTKKIINTLSKLADGIDYSMSKSVKDFIKDSKLRKASYKRIVVSDTFLSKNPKNDFKQLSSFLKEFADGTEIVLILKEPNSAIETQFLDEFNSPLYTIAYLPKPTPNSLLNIIKESMPTVKARYYELDKGKSGHNSGVDNENTENSSKNEETSGVESNKRETITETRENISEETINPYSVNSNSNSDNNSSYGSERQNSINGNHENSEFSDNGSYSTGENNFDGEFSDYDDDLGVGEFGAAHNDTDMFSDEDEEGLAELEQHKANMEKEEEKLQQEDNEIDSEKIKDDEEVNQEEDDWNLSAYAMQQYEENYEKPEIKENKPVIKDTTQDNKPVKITPKKGITKPVNHGNNKIVLVSGLNGSGITQWIIDRAAEGANRGKSVLVIDLDYLCNGILSFIDSAKFYNSGCQNGDIYEEDGVHFISSGYGNYLDNVISVLSNKELLSSYDAVFIDCPVESLKSIPEDILDNISLYICSLSDISKLIELSIKLTSRDYTSLKTEIAFMSRSKVIYTDGKSVSKEDIDYVKDLLFMPNGYWFD